MSSKSVDRVCGPGKIRFASGRTERILIFSADVVGIWTEEGVFVPWSAVDWIKPDND